jgi:SsrA-binding protein
MKKNQASAHLITNRRARFDYHLLQEYSVGIVLNGPEVRAVRDHRISLRGAYVTVKDDELWLLNASFSLSGGKQQTVVDTRTRKLLASRKEINALAEAKEKGHTIVPLSMTTTTRFIKLTIAEGKGKKLHDKRETIKQRDMEREHRRQHKITS